MFNFFSPISYNTDVNSIIYAYNTGATYGYRPGTLPGYTPQFNLFANNNFGASIFNFGTSPAMNSFQTLLNATNPMGGSYNQCVLNGPVYNFGSSKKVNSISVHTPSQTFAYSKTATKTSTKTDTIHPTASNRASTPKTFDRSELVTNAMKYLGCDEASKGHLKFMTNKECRFMDPYNEEWCTDFVTYVAKETYRKQGLTAPYWFGSHDVATLKRQAAMHGKFINTTKETDKALYISKNIKVGDIMILNQNGASHTGFVTKVNSDGSFETIEGNVGDPGGVGNGKVTTGRYYADEKDLSGFIRLI